MDITEFITITLKGWSHFLPLPWFAFIGAFIEELTPIPASLVMTVLGSLSAVKGHGILILFELSLIAALGKEIGYLVVYFLGDRGEDILLKKFGRFFGVKHEQVEAIGKHLNKGWTDDLIIFLFRAIPIIPTMAVSLVCGVIKVNFRTYMISSFLGTIVRNSIYIWIGFSGIGILKDGINIWIWIGFSVICIGGAVMFFYRKDIKNRLKL